MATETTNLHLVKPDKEEYYDVDIRNDNWDKIDAAMSAARSAEEYDAAGTYALDAYCTHDGKLYRCTTPITTAEEWNADHWAETSVGAELEAMLAALAAHTGNHSNPHGVTRAQIGAATTQLLYCTVPVSWTASGSFYYQQVSVPGVLSNDEKIHFDINPGSDNAANKLYAEAWGKVQTVDTLNGAIKLWATAAPTTAFPLKLEVVR